MTDPDSETAAEKIAYKADQIRVMPEVLRDMAKELNLARGYRSILNNAADLFDLLTARVLELDSKAMDAPDGDDGMPDHAAVPGI